MPRCHIPDLPWEEQRSPGGRFHSFHRNVSLALGGLRNGGTWCGGHPFDVQYRRVPPGAAICPLHSHLAQWELFLVQRGAGRVRVGAESHEVVAGDVFVHPPGAAHQLSNPGPDELEVLIVADNPELDGCYYPDSAKWGLRPPGKFFRMDEVGYFDGEEPPVAGAPPHRVAGFPAPPALAPFAQRRIAVDALPWDEWFSPRRRFHGYSKELSIALGAKRNAPSGLGGHPFDLELNKLDPGEAGCPFHSHAAQWELFLVQAGRGLIRAGDATHEAGPGDAFLHPPGEAHQIRAAAGSELVFLLLADNPPVDYWEYPDSRKWGLRAPRKFFRPVEVDYWDGEEA